MTKRRALLLAALVLPFLLLVPGSPLYLPTLLGGGGGQHSGHSTQHWIKSLNSSEPEVRYQALFALGAIGTEAGAAVPALATILTEDADAEARHQAALALAKMVPASRTAVPALARALTDEEPAVRMNAAFALLRLRTEARPAIPALIEAMGDKANDTNLKQFHCTIQEMAALALGRASTGSSEGVAPLTAALKAARTPEMRRTVARALGEIGPPARSAVPLLRALLKEDSDVRRAATEALEKIGPKQGGSAGKN
jgi:HEAT repeat protein